MDDPSSYNRYDPTTAFTLRLREAEQLRSSAERLIAEGASMFKEATEREARPRFSITRAINCAISGSRLEGPEKQWSERIADSLGLAPSPAKPHIPWAAFASQRAMIAGTATQGGYLVGDPALQAIDILRPFSTLLRLGAQVFPGLVGDVSVPRVGTGATAAWLGETGTATSGDWTLEQVTTTPKKVSAYVEISRQLLAQAPTVADSMVSANLLGAVGQAIDQAMLSGTGGNSPLGILNTSGVALALGTGFNLTAAAALLKNVSTANVVDDSIRFLAPPATRELLQKRSAVIGTSTSADRAVWQGGMLADKPALVSGNVPSAQIYCADFSQAWLMIWGLGALQVEINPFANLNFRAGIVGVRCVAHIDVAVVRPGAFAVGTGIT